MNVTVGMIGSGFAEGGNRRRRGQKGPRAAGLALRLGLGLGLGLGFRLRLRLHLCLGLGLVLRLRICFLFGSFLSSIFFSGLLYESPRRKPG